ncbi:hypothetical protein FALCPG4_016817 [Fusarium falciforme]
MSDSSVMQQLCPMDFQFSAGDNHNPSSDAAVQHLSLSSCMNSMDLQGMAANNSNGVAFPLPNSMPVGSRDLTPQMHDTRTAHNIQRPGNQLVNAPAASQNATPTPLAPASINHQEQRSNIATRKLPPKRRGGRRAFWRMHSLQKVQDRV